MPSATAVLGFSKSDRDMLGGWSAEGSERHSRAVKYKITNVQKAVAHSSRVRISILLEWRTILMRSEIS